jgi:two-component system sensor histidine kinase KdpD
MAKLENGMVKDKSESIEVGALLRNCLMRMSNRLRDVTVNISPAEALPAYTDPVLLSRAVCLILDNAVKYGGNPPHIQIDYGTDEMNRGFIDIRDNGPGIATTQRETIFSKYTRFAKEDQQNAGTGLGLSIGRAIMQLLSGDLEGSIHADGRTLFTLRFPLSANPR